MLTLLVSKFSFTDKHLLNDPDAQRLLVKDLTPNIFMQLDDVCFFFRIKTIVLSGGVCSSDR